MNDRHSEIRSDMDILELLIKKSFGKKRKQLQRLRMKMIWALNEID